MLLQGNPTWPLSPPPPPLLFLMLYTGPVIVQPLISPYVHNIKTICRCFLCLFFGIWSYISILSRLEMFSHEYLSCLFTLMSILFMCIDRHKLIRFLGRPDDEMIYSFSSKPGIRMISMPYDPVLPVLSTTYIWCDSRKHWGGIMGGRWYTGKQQVTRNHLSFSSVHCALGTQRDTISHVSICVCM